MKINYISDTLVDNILGDTSNFIGVTTFIHVAIYAIVMVVLACTKVPRKEIIAAVWDLSGDVLINLLQVFSIVIINLKPIFSASFVIFVSVGLVWYYIDIEGSYWTSAQTMR